MLKYLLRRCFLHVIDLTRHSSLFNFDKFKRSMKGSKTYCKKSCIHSWINYAMKPILFFLKKNKKMNLKKNSTMKWIRIFECEYSRVLDMNWKFWMKVLSLQKRSSSAGRILMAKLVEDWVVKKYTSKNLWYSLPQNRPLRRTLLGSLLEGLWDSKSNQYSRHLVALLLMILLV